MPAGSTSSRVHEPPVIGREFHAPVDAALEAPAPLVVGWWTVPLPNLAATAGSTLAGWIARIATARK